MRKFTIGAFATASTLALATAAAASVTFDPNTGTGFVGKGDVQAAFGWNNAAAQANISGLTFSFERDVSFDVTCEWDTIVSVKGGGTGVRHNFTTTPETSAVSASTQFAARKNNQIDGILLTGLASSGDSGAPVVGGPCVGGDGVTPGTITNVTPLGDSGPGTLFVMFNGNKQPLGQF